MATSKKHKTRAQTDDQRLDKTLKDTFPASDASSGNVIEEKASRPVHRRPAEIDTATVDKLAREARQKVGKG